MKSKPAKPKGAPGNPLGIVSGHSIAPAPGTGQDQIEKFLGRQDEENQTTDPFVWGKDERKKS
jgi:hypothetical protein